MLFTNDGELGNSLLHPKKSICKTYLATIEGTLSQLGLDQLRSGVQLEDGKCNPADVEILCTDGNTSKVLMSISQGKKRQVRRMFKAVGNEVISLHRQSFAGLKLDDLQIGEVRELNEDEITNLIKLTGLGA